MENTHTHPPTKDQALRKLGVRSRKIRNQISGHVDLVHRAPGQSLMTPGTISAATIACVTGTAVVNDANGNSVSLDGPFVVGDWACDDRRIAEYSVAVAKPATFLVIDWNVRDLVFAQVPRLYRLSKTTQQAVDTTDEVIEMPAEPMPFIMPAVAGYLPI